MISYFLAKFYLFSTIAIFNIALKRKKKKMLKAKAFISSTLERVVKPSPELEDRHGVLFAILTAEAQHLNVPPRDLLIDHAVFPLEVEALGLAEEQRRPELVVLELPVLARDHHGHHAFPLETSFGFFEIFEVLNTIKKAKIL